VIPACRKAGIHVSLWILRPPAVGLSMTQSQIWIYQIDCRCFEPCSMVLLGLMAPQPKRKHSKARKGKRILARKQEKSLPQLVMCKNCGKRKLPQQVCKNCNK